MVNLTSTGTQRSDSKQGSHYITIFFFFDFKFNMTKAEHLIHTCTENLDLANAHKKLAN